MNRDLNLHVELMKIRESVIPQSTYAVIGVYVRNGRYFAVTTRDKGEWILCGGKVDDGETDDEALCREFIEESGLKPTKYRLFDMYFTDEAVPKLCKTYLIDEMEVVDDRMVGFLENPLDRNFKLLDETEGLIGWINENDLVDAGLYGEYNSSVVDMLKLLNYEHLNH